MSDTWTHSFEEDTGSEQVFRPTASYPFPRSRRPRATLDLTGGALETATPGPDDRMQRSIMPVTSIGTGRYRLEDGREIEVIEAGSDVLRIRLV